MAELRGDFVATDDVSWGGSTSHLYWMLAVGCGPGPHLDCHLACPCGWRVAGPQACASQRRSEEEAGAFYALTQKPCSLLSTVRSCLTDSGFKGRGLSWHLVGGSHVT